MRRYITALALAFAITASAAYAQCVPRSIAEKSMRENGQELQAKGFSKMGNVIIELWANEGGDWIIFFNSPDGNACALDFGVDFRTEEGIEG